GEPAALRLQRKMREDGPCVDQVLRLVEEGQVEGPLDPVDRAREAAAQPVHGDGVHLASAHIDLAPELAWEAQEAAGSAAEVQNAVAWLRGAVRRPLVLHYTHVG